MRTFLHPPPSGESGSGKTEAFKHIVRHLTARSSPKGFALEPRMKHVSQSNHHLFEEKTRFYANRQYQGTSNSPDSLWLITKVSLTWVSRSCRRWIYASHAYKKEMLDLGSDCESIYLFLTIQINRELIVTDTVTTHIYSSIGSADYSSP